MNAGSVFSTWSSSCKKKRKKKKELLLNYCLSRRKIMIMKGLLSLLFLGGFIHLLVKNEEKMTVKQPFFTLLCCVVFSSVTTQDVIKEENLRDDLKFYFMSPCEKYRARRHLPWKLGVQILKIVMITTQVCSHNNMFSRNQWKNLVVMFCLEFHMGRGPT